MKYKYFSILLTPFVLLAPVYLAGKALFWGTPLLQFVPWWNWAWETLRAGQLPLWNPLLGMGAPLIANYQSALFYPPTWLYFLLAAAGGLPALAWGQAILVALHLAWAGLGMALLARRLGLSSLAQVVAGLSFGLSGYLVSRAGFLSINAAAAWVPWVILGVTRLIEGHQAQAGHPLRRWPAFLLLALVAALQLLAGHAQTTWYTWLLAGMWAGYWGWKKAQPEKDRLALPARALWLAGVRGALRAGSGLALALLLACGLAAVQLGPTLEYLLESQRSAEVDYDFAMTYSFWPWRLLSLLASDLFGSPAHGDYWGYGFFWEDALYVGLLPLLLAASAAFAALQPAVVKRKRLAFRQPLSAVPFLLFLLPFSLILALGKNTPLFPWLYHNVPTFDMFQAPARYLIWLEFALALLAGYGAHAWQRPTGRALYWTRLGTAGALAVSLGAGLAWFLAVKAQAIPEISLTFIRSTALAGGWALVAGVLSLLAPPAFPGQEKEVFGVPKYVVRWSWAVVVVIMVDLLVAGWGLNPAVSLDVYQQTAATASELYGLADGRRLFIAEPDERQLKFDRFLVTETFQPGEEWTQLRAVLLPNLSLLEGLASANNFDPLVPGRYARWMKYLDQADPHIRQHMLELMDVGVVEHVQPAAENGVQFEPFPSGVVGGAGQSRRARWIACARPVSGAEAAWEQVTAGQLDFQAEVILEQEGLDRAEQKCESSSAASLEIVSDTPNRLRFLTRSASSGWLVLADVWYPGWQAWVDGEPVAIWRANYLFRAVPVAGGEHEVVLAYRPVPFWLGLVISGLAWAAVIAWAFKMPLPRA